MAKFHLGGGLEIETTTPAELKGYMDRRDQQLAQRLRGIKFRRLPPIFGQVTAAGIQIGGDYPPASGQTQAQLGPESGHAWILRHMAVSGLTGGATPDLLNLNFFGAGGGAEFAWWQFNGNNFAYAWGKNELWLIGGEYLGFTSQGAVTAAVGTKITIRGHIQQVPEELMAELV